MALRAIKSEPDCFSPTKYGDKSKYFFVDILVNILSQDVLLKKFSLKVIVATMALLFAAPSLIDLESTNALR